MLLRRIAITFLNIRLMLSEEIYKEMHVEHIRLSGNFDIIVILHT